MSRSASISDLATHVGFWLRLVSNHVSHAFATKLADREVTVAEWAVMRTLYGREPIAPSRLAAEMGMTRGAISKLADRLVAKSLILREASLNDGRAHTLALTEPGQNLVPHLAALADCNDAEFFGCLTGGEREMLTRLLKNLAERSHITAIPIE